MTKSEKRKFTFELLYSLEIQKDAQKDYKEQIEMFLTENNIKQTSIENYIFSTVKGIITNQEEILKLISKNLKQGWDITRVSKIDLTILKLAIYEIIYTKLPYKIVINEVVEIAKKYGDDSSPVFVNGVLANVIKQIEE